MVALTRDELMALWASSVDPEFARELLEKPDSGIEVVEAAAEVMAMASVSIEKTSQSFFLRRHSAQTYPPATGAQKSQVNVDLARAAPASDAIVLQPGLFFLEETVVDFSEDGGVMVGTGRR